MTFQGPFQLYDFSYSWMPQQGVTDWQQNQLLKTTNKRAMKYLSLSVLYLSLCKPRISIPGLILAAYVVSFILCLIWMFTFVSMTTNMSKVSGYLSKMAKTVDVAEYLCIVYIKNSTLRFWLVLDYFERVIWTMSTNL